LGALLAFLEVATLSVGAPGTQPSRPAEDGARQRAVTLLRDRVADPDRLRHAFAVEATMRGLARETGGDPAEWGLAGLLHDIDLAETAAAGHPSKHGIVGARLLAEHGYSEAVVHAVAAHDDAAGVERTRRNDALMPLRERGSS
jgi:putative nucleotidyltransferase with HDIG domain